MSDELPDWVVSEIQTVRFRSSKTLDGTGYILELYEEDGKADVQLDDPVEDGRHIVTMDLAGGIRTDTLEKGALYSFTFEQHKAPLSKKAARYLQTEKGVDMGAIYRFDLSALELIDAGAGEYDDDDDL